jgi:hypothetical protein
MKKRYLPLLLLFWILTVGSLWAQPPGPATQADIEALKVGFITRRLNLTADEAKTFWPVYDAYAAEMKEVKEGMRLEKRNAKKNFDLMTDEEVNAAMESMLAFKRRELDVTLKYHEEFKRVLPVRKVGQLYRAEQEFTRLLLERLQERREENGGTLRPGGPGGPGRRF